MEARFERAGEAFAQLCACMAQLRAPDGCAWDREQTLQSLRPYLLEEAHELQEAMVGADAAAHQEELGDVLLQVVFQAELVQEAGGFDVAAVVQGLRAKLVRRHPHVFADAVAPTGAAVAQAWERIKAQERPAGRGLFSGIPASLPALLRAARMGEKAAAVGFDFPELALARAKAEEEWQELRQALDTGAPPAEVAGEMGDVIFALVSLCRHLHLDPEAALKTTLLKFTRRFAHIEAALAARGERPDETPLAEMVRLWNDAKDQERQEPAKP